MSTDESFFRFFFLVSQIRLASLSPSSSYSAGREFFKFVIYSGD